MKERERPLDGRLLPSCPSAKTDCSPERPPETGGPWHASTSCTSTASTPSTTFSHAGSGHPRDGPDGTRAPGTPTPGLCDPVQPSSQERRRPTMRMFETMIGISLVLSLGAALPFHSALAMAPGTEGEDEAKSAFATLEARLPGLDEGKRRLLLSDLATAAFDAGETAKATQFANELLSPSPAAQRWAR